MVLTMGDERGQDTDGVRSTMGCGLSSRDFSVLCNILRWDHWALPCRPPRWCAKCPGRVTMRTQRLGCASPRKNRPFVSMLFFSCLERVSLFLDDSADEECSQRRRNTISWVM